MARPKEELQPIDWEKPLIHSQAGIHVEYVGKRTHRGGQEITDGYHHLIITGAGTSVFVDDFGRIHREVDGKPRPTVLVRNPPEPKPEPEAKPARGDGPVSDLTDAIDALRDELTQARESMQKESQNLRRLLHAHLSDQGDLIRKYVNEMKDQSSKSQGDFLAALQLATDGLYGEIVRAIKDAFHMMVPAAGEPPEEPEPADDEPDPQPVAVAPVPAPFVDVVPPPPVPEREPRRVVVPPREMPPEAETEGLGLTDDSRIKADHLKTIRSDRLRLAVDYLARLPEVSSVVPGDAARKQSKGVPVGSLRVRRPTNHGLEVVGYDVHQARTYWVYTKDPEEVVSNLEKIKSIIFQVALSRGGTRG